MAIIGWKVTRPTTLGNLEQVQTFMVADDPAAILKAQDLEDTWSREHRAGVKIMLSNPDYKPPGEPTKVPIFDAEEQNLLDKPKDAPKLGRPTPKGEVKTREPVRSGRTGGYRLGEHRSKHREPYD